MSSKAKRKPPPDTAQLEVAVVGSGITPEDVNIKQLAELLSATAATLDALAADRGVAAVQPSLKTIRRGSAVAVLWSEEAIWPEMMRSFYDAVETRGAKASEKVRSALFRLHRSVKMGAVSVGAADVRGAQKLPRIVMAAPVDTKTTKTAFTSTLYGRVVGVNHYADRIAVKIEHVDGGREEFDADKTVTDQAARLFNKMVRADVQMDWDGHARHSVSLRELKPWSESDFVDTLVDARRELHKLGIKIDFDAAMKELEG